MPLFKQMISIINRVDPKTGEPIQMEGDKPYLLLLKPFGSVDENTAEDEPYEAYPFRGRNSVLVFLASNLYAFDIVNSYVLTGNIKITEAISVYSFLRGCIDKGYCGEYDELTLDSLEDSALESNYNRFDSIYLDKLYAQEINKPIKK